MTTPSFDFAVALIAKESERMGIKIVVFPSPITESGVGILTPACAKGAIAKRLICPMATIVDR